ncbi:hypothetical protein FM21_29770 [Streptomyces mutabilis]|uniref:Uncharacterized protein n=1 Tax=Streptomyces mutabilis TaxID=67332 RepID=A0A086MTW8_9ACTN|nr:hypothetical protein FM21_29770 [Streptomyces mutabilis]
MRVAPAYRKALDRVPRSAAVRFLPVRSPTAVSTGPTKRGEDVKSERHDGHGDLAQHLCAQPLGCLVRLPQREDRGADLLDGDVELVAGPAHPVTHLGRERPALGAIQHHSRGEQPLGDEFARMPRDAAAVLVDRERSRSRWAPAIIRAGTACEANRSLSARSVLVYGRSPRTRGSTSPPRTRPSLHGAAA